jgi:hypothetical protein
VSDLIDFERHLSRPWDVITDGRNRNSSVGIAKGYGAGKLGLEPPAGARQFFPFHSIQIGSGPRLASYPMGTEGLFPLG